MYPLPSLCSFHTTLRFRQFLSMWNISEYARLKIWMICSWVHWITFPKISRTLTAPFLKNATSNFKNTKNSIFYDIRKMVRWKSWKFGWYVVEYVNKLFQKIQGPSPLYFSIYNINLEKHFGLVKILEILKSIDTTEFHIPIFYLSIKKISLLHGNSVNYTIEFYRAKWPLGGN